MDSIKKYNNYQNITSCLLCNSTNLRKIFSVDEVCLTGYFPLKNENDPIKTPVSLVKCTSCNNVQAQELVRADLMFRDYWYRSSTTGTMRDHLKDIVERIIKPEGVILDIGSNDGTLLDIAEQKGMKVWGVEPSDAIKDAPFNIKEKTVNTFFGSRECDQFLQKTKVKFDVITAISMFYDVAEPLKFIEKARDLLTPDGLILIEVNYAKSFFERQNIDMLGQEHLIYYFIETFSDLISKANLFINDAYLTDMNGGNITFTISRTNKKSEKYLALTNEEKSWMENFNFIKFEKIVREGFNKFKEEVISLSESNTIKVLGASTRGAMIIQMLGLDNKVIATAVDLQQNKVGRRIPGTNIVIEFDGEHDIPDYYLVMPYQFRTEIISRYLDFMKSGGGLLFYRPKQEIITYDNKTKKIKYTPIV
jgi:2-polyprenyl-3-methyl-5-hydroxy-6-metoxy-1,4-benzoquinol methylase